MCGACREAGEGLGGDRNFQKGISRWEMVTPLRSDTAAAVR